MDDHPRMSSSLYDYTDKSIPHAGTATIVYGVIALASGLLQWLQFMLYHRPGGAGWLHQDFLSEQWLQHTPAATAITLVVGGIVAIISGILAFGIFRRSKIAVVLMLLLVIIPQLYTWFVLHSFAGTIVSVVVAGFLLRGAARIFERPDENYVSKTPNA